jgi:hypothetical protein
MSSGLALAYMTDEEIAVAGQFHLDKTMAACRDEIAACTGAGRCLNDGAGG